MKSFSRLVISNMLKTWYLCKHSTDLAFHLTHADLSLNSYISYASVFLLKLLRPELADCTDTEAILTEVEASVKCLEEVSVDETHTPALYAGFVRVLLHSKQSKPQNGDGVVTLDPALTSKLLESQQSGRVADAFNAAPVGDIISSMNEPIASQHQMEPSASVYQHTFAQEPQSGYHSGESNLQQWNLDQLGQSGFWENLSMREYTIVSRGDSVLTCPLQRALALRLRTASLEDTSSRVTHGLSPCPTRQRHRVQLHQGLVLPA